MNVLENASGELESGKLRIAQLERAAIERSADAERELRRQLDRYQSLVLAIAQVVWTHDPNGEMHGEQPSWGAYTGQTLLEYEGRGWLDAVHPDDRAGDQEGWERAALARAPCEYEHRLRRHDGEYRYFSVRAVPVFDDSGAIREWAGIHTDIDERKRTEDQLRSSAARLQQSNRELEDFATVASHDLQEPLRKIQAFVGCLRDEQPDALNAEARDYLDRIQGAANRMATLVSDLLELSRVSSNGQRFFPVDLGEVAAEVLSDLEARIAQTGGRVEVSHLPTVVGDATQMRQLLQNLVGNALKFHRKGVPPVVRVSAEIVDGPSRSGLRRAAEASGASGAHAANGSNAASGANATCRITVADNGIGFDEKYLDRVFKIFQRLNARGAYEGTGIGLAICRKIVERHCGTITATSTTGAGSTFVVSMPLSQRDGGAHGP
jgi:PAS domain S-box-containing protein